MDDNVNWPPAILISLLGAASISIPPAEAFNLIEDSFVPCIFVITIVSLVPTFVVKDIAFASSVFDENVNWPPEILTSLPAAASISTPPANEFNWIADSSVPLVLIILRSSFPGVADAATIKYASWLALPSTKFFSSATLKSIPPLLEYIFIASLPVPWVL